MMYTGIVELDLINDDPRDSWDEDWSNSCVGMIEEFEEPYEGWALYVNF